MPSSEQMSLKLSNRKIKDAEMLEMISTLKKFIWTVCFVVFLLHQEKVSVKQQHYYIKVTKS